MARAVRDSGSWSPDALAHGPPRPGRRTPPPAPARDGDPSDTSDGNKPIRRRALGRRTSTSPRARLVWLDPGPASRGPPTLSRAPAPPPISCSGCRPAGTAPPPCWWIIHGHSLLSSGVVVNSGPSISKPARSPWPAQFVAQVGLDTVEWEMVHGCPWTSAL